MGLCMRIVRYRLNLSSACFDFVLGGCEVELENLGRKLACWVVWRARLSSPNHLAVCRSFPSRC